MSKNKLNVGQIVEYTPDNGDGFKKNGVSVGEGSLAAIVASVNGDTVNLTVFDVNGTPHAVANVPASRIGGDDTPIEKPATKKK
jgi:hypothetical protein